MAGKRQNLSPLTPTKRSRRNISVEGDGSSQMGEGVLINALPDEILGSILSRLTTKELVGVEAVSRRWRSISRQYAWRSTTHLYITQSLIDDVTNARRDLSTVEKRKIFKRRVKCLFDRCSSHLRSVKVYMPTHHPFTGPHMFTDANIVNLISTARNLTTLEFYNIPVTVRTASLIGDRLLGLERLKLSRCFEKLTSSKADQALTAILEGCQLLQELDISRNERLTGETSFAHLPPTLRSLNISSCRLQPSVIEHVRSACVDGYLRELDVSSLPIDGPILGMGRLFEALPLLEKLDYRYSYYPQNATLRETATALAKISTMKRLKSLDLRENPLITVEVLQTIVSSCTELTSLVFGDMRGLSEEKLLAVVSGGRLKKLGLDACPLVTDTIIRRVLERCGELRELNISDCRSVSRVTVKAIGEFVAGIAQSLTTTDAEQRFHLRCYGSSIEARPGELEAELLAAHPVLKHVRQRDSKYGALFKAVSLDIRW